MIRLTYTQYSSYFVCHVDNLHELDLATLKALESFAAERSGTFDYVKESFRIPKRIELQHLKALFSLKGLDAFITQELPVHTKPLNTGVINFGKFKGTKWIDLKEDYLTWLGQNLSGSDRQTAIDELQRRKQKSPEHIKELPSCLNERIGFGKYKGKLWNELPTEYLQWIAGNMSGINAQYASDILVHRNN